MFRFVAILLLATATVRAETLTVNVTTEGPREGVIAILVFNSKEGFPSQNEKAFRKIRVPVTAEGPIACTITNLPYGVYSITVLHDINDNYKADKMFGVGPPKEPVGFSNIDRKLRKKPRFSDTLITFSSQTNRIAIAARYVF